MPSRFDREMEFTPEALEVLQGITEETDCLSLVVSEETGRISVAAFGEIEPGLSVSDVDHRISVHFGVQRVRRRGEEEYLPADIPLASEATDTKKAHE